MARMLAPAYNGPKDLPELRQWLIKAWRPGTRFDLTAQLYEHHINGTATNAAVRTAGEWSRDVLSDATLFHVDADALDEIIEMYSSWPDDGPVRAEDAPAACGFVVFARPFYGADSQNEGSVCRVDAVCWGPVQVGAAGEYAGVGIASYTKTTLGSANDDEWASMGGIVRLFGADLDERGDLIGDFFWPLGRTDWLWGSAPTDPVPGSPPLKVEDSLVEDRKLLGTLWKLMSMNVLQHNHVRADRPTSRRAQRAGITASSDVTVLTWGTTANETSSTTDSPTDTTVRWSARWVVRPHFRTQRYGPGSTLRKVILIESFVKGPAGLPVKHSERVFRLTPRTPSATVPAAQHDSAS